MCELPIPQDDPLPPGTQIIVNTTVDLDGRTIFHAVQRQRLRRRGDDDPGVPVG